jgi:Na+-translocating ferredoxin:NAD+ oxidoreductase RnfG subunit
MRGAAAMVGVAVTVGMAGAVAMATRAAIADAAVTSQFTAADAVLPSTQAGAIAVAATEAAADTMEAAAITARSSEVDKESPANAWLTWRTRRGSCATAPIAASTRAKTKLPSKKNQKVSATQSP